MGKRKFIFILLPAVFVLLGCIDFAIRGLERDDADSLKKNCGKMLCDKLC